MKRYKGSPFVKEVKTDVTKKEGKALFVCARLSQQKCNNWDDCSWQQRISPQVKIGFSASESAVLAWNLATVFATIGNFSYVTVTIFWISFSSWIDHAFVERNNIIIVIIANNQIVICEWRERITRENLGILIVCSQI